VGRCEPLHLDAFRKFFLVFQGYFRFSKVNPYPEAKICTRYRRDATVHRATAGNGCCLKMRWALESLLLRS
jgi:hypothetical protein